MKNEKLGNPGREGLMTPPQKIVGLKLCWVVVSIAVRCCITHFRPLGPFSLEELEFLVGWWGGGVCVK